MSEDNKGIEIKLTCEEVDEGFNLFQQVSNPKDDYSGLKAYLAWIDNKVNKTLNTGMDKLQKMDFDYVNGIRKQVHLKVVSKIDFLKSSLK